MFFYCNMRWDLKGLSFDELWDLEYKETVHAKETIASGDVRHLYKVAAKQRVVAYVNAASLEELDRNALGRLPMHEHLIFEDVWVLEESYTHTDVPAYLEKRRAALETDANFLFSVVFSWGFREKTLDHCWQEILNETLSFSKGVILGIYRVAAQQRAIVLVDVKSAEDINALSSLPAYRNAGVEEVMGLRDYILFADDVAKHYKGI